MYISPTISHISHTQTVLGIFLFAPLSHAHFLWIFPAVRLYIPKQKLWSVQWINRFFQSVSCQFNCLAIALDRCQRYIHIATKTFSPPHPPTLWLSSHSCQAEKVKQKEKLTVKKTGRNGGEKPVSTTLWHFINYCQQGIAIKSSFFLLLPDYLSLKKNPKYCKCKIMPLGLYST